DEAGEGKKVHEARHEARESGDGKLEGGRAEIAQHEARVRRATVKMRAAQRVAGQFVPWTLIGGAIASLLVAGLISVGLSGLAIAAPFAVGIIVALSLTNVATAEQEITDKETEHGQHLRSGATGPGGRNARRHTSAGRTTASGKR